MKNIIYIFLCMMLLSSCEDYFTTVPQGNPDADGFYKNANELQLGLNSVYEILTSSGYQTSEWLFGEGCGDDVSRLKGLEEGDAKTRVMQFTFSNDNSNILSRWQQNYKGIYRANWVIHSAPSLKFHPSLSDVEKNEVRYILGQAKALRALFYFNLVKTYGGVPIKPEHIYIDDEGNNNFYQARNTVSEVYEYIERDLRESILILKDTYNTEATLDELGKISRDAVMGILMKVLAYQADDGVGHYKWTQVRELGEVMVERAMVDVTTILDFNELYADTNLDSLAYKLLLDSIPFSNTIASSSTANIDIDYDVMWHSAGEFHSGSLFEINHMLLNGSSISVTTNWSSSLCASETKPNPNNIQPTSELYDYGKTTNDPRILSNVLSQGDSYPTFDGVDGSIGGVSGPEFKACFKWAALGQEQRNEKNFRVMRFAEIMLFYAEALNELGESDKAIDIVNKIRLRARSIAESGRWSTISDVSYPKQLGYGSYIKVRDNIWEERHIELIFEFDRFWDLVRTGQADKQINQEYNTYRQDVFKKQYTKGVNEIFPIPQQEIDLSGGVVTQNPGY